ncbi:MAG: hypothetical protein ACKO5F_04485 [Synechococcus sp.]
MADDTTPSMSQERHEAPSRGGRPGANREPGGFRIRLSDNEMRAARALQEAFGLRSTVAVLGFSVRSLAQMLEQGQLEGLLAEHRAQGGGRGPAGEGRGRRPEGRRSEGRPEPAARVNPFARPAAAAAVEEEAAPEAPVEAVEAPDAALESAEADAPVVDAEAAATAG